MRRLLQHWTESSIILTSIEESVWRKKRPKKRTVSFAEDRSLTWSTSTSGSLEPMILSSILPTFLLFLFEMMIFRNSIRNGTEFYCPWRKSHLMTSWQVCTNMNHLQTLQLREVWIWVNTVLFSHFPKDRNCEICQRTKMIRAPCRRRNGGAVLRAEIFGDLITADHNVLSENCESRNNHRYAVVVQDLATQWIQSYQCKTKTSQETQRSLQKFLEPDRKPKVIYSDTSLEFGKACEDLSWNHCTSTPHRSETNGIAQRAVRRVKEGTSAVLLQSGLNENWWADSMECYAYLRKRHRSIIWWEDVLWKTFRATI